MSKVIRVLSFVLVSVLFVASPTEATTKKPIKKPAKPRKLSKSELALRQRVIDFYVVTDEEFEKETPNIDRILEFASPEGRDDFRKELERRAAIPTVTVETRALPVNVKRVILSKLINPNKAYVEFCFVRSRVNIVVGEAIPADKSTIPVDGSRTREQWLLIDGLWRQSGVRPMATYTEGWQCEKAS